MRVWGEDERHEEALRDCISCINEHKSHLSITFPREKEAKLVDFEKAAGLKDEGILKNTAEDEQRYCDKHIVKTATFYLDHYNHNMQSLP